VRAEQHRFRGRVIRRVDDRGDRTAVNPAFQGEEITQVLRQAGARWLVTSAELVEEKMHRCALAADVRQTFVLGAADQAPTGTIAFACRYPDIGAGVPAGRVGPADVAFLPWSSGTSGLPKNVVLTHRNLVASLCQTRPVHRVGGDDVVIAALPLFHSRPQDRGRRAIRPDGCGGRCTPPNWPA
jgi:acyl-CoA synthetase (AMP-forming)/AMP-acid ligase II